MPQKVHNLDEEIRCTFKDKTVCAWELKAPSEARLRDQAVDRVRVKLWAG